MSVSISLDNPGTITKGTTLTGTVTCRFPSEETIRGIECSLRGKECTRWTQGSGKNSTTYTGKHKFIIQDINFVGAGTIDSGVYEYSFLFTIPDIPLPSSYIHTLGSVQYFIRAKVDRPFAIDYEDSITLHVAPVVDLNDEPDQQQLTKSTYQFEKFPTICCCTSEPLNVDLVLNKRAFVLEDVIEGKLNIENMSDLQVSQIEISLVWHLKFTAERPRKREREEEKVYAKQIETGLEGYSEKSYNFMLHIPQMAILNFTGCYLIQQRWIVRIHIIFPSCHRNIKCDADIKIGHIPLGAIDSRDISAPQSTAAGGHPEITPSAPELEEDRIPLIDEDSPSAPPPTYADATK
ncbi:arrestin domain-containing protein 3-like isoform X1 [Diorhabda sublineata]|uniref:arrestin domain-containing protein 3-like isoform X1 n=1 Tax=Diorhabda sublineata TaxID=1163346 RepID=UPI0024E136D5|nr:arrestin domain-containing protein 3-like isoform X1 [Diorhabda sublineata]XP_056634648.1 arrestin domain-containing protein 3-like isoform X1 [Diorhabda sublineata]